MTDAQRTYNEAVAKLPYSKCGRCSAVYHTAQCPYCPKVLPGWNPHTQSVSRPKWGDMRPDEAKAWLLEDMGLD